MTDFSQGLDLSRMDQLSPEEISANLMHVYSWRGGTYEFGANALMLDYAPQFAKLHRWGQDRAAITGWYQRTIGYLPASIDTGLRYDPAFVKMHRAKWEAAIRTLPKQVIPYLQLRLNMMTGSVPGLREAALLARAWGISRTHAVKAVTASAMYFTSFEGLYTMHDAMADILEDWPEG